MKRTQILGLVAAAATWMAGGATATPTTNIWNPSTDVQAAGAWHLGIDNYFSVQKNDTQAVAFGTDVGLTFGLGSGLEVGVDYFGPARPALATDVHPVLLNAKWGMPERAGLPAFAVGIQQLGAHKATQANVAYALLAKNVGKLGRVTAGGYAGKKSILAGDGEGAILAWDRAFGDKWWASVDWASGNSAYGALAVGGSRKFAPNVGLIVGYVLFNESSLNPNDVVTTQLDIDF